jgi:hypothetical protein
MAAQEGTRRHMAHRETETDDSVFGLECYRAAGGRVKEFSIHGSLRRARQWATEHDE